MSKDIKEVGLVNFPVKDQELIDLGYYELSTRELARMRRAEWARISSLPGYRLDDYGNPERAFYKAIAREISNRHQPGRENPIPDSSDVDGTYIYPGDPAPPGFKWMLVADNGPGVVAYRVHTPSDVEYIYE